MKQINNSQQNEKSGQFDQISNLSLFGFTLVTFFVSLNQIQALLPKLLRFQSSQSILLGAIYSGLFTLLFFILSSLVQIITNKNKVSQNPQNTSVQTLFFLLLLSLILLMIGQSSATFLVVSGSL
jgi:hypothetical protein